MFEETVHKLMMGLTADDVRAAINAGAAKEMRSLVEAMGWLAFRWWTAAGDKNPEMMREIQSRLAELQGIIIPRQ